MDAQGPAVVESVSDSHRAGTGVSQERKRRFLEVMAEHDLSSADGEERVRRLVSAGLVAQDARAVVRQYYIQVGRCALEAMEIMAEEEGQRFDVVFADIEQALQDSRRAELLFVMISVDSMLDYCTLAASQAAGLPAPELE